MKPDELNAALTTEAIKRLQSGEWYVTALGCGRALRRQNGLSDLGAQDADAIVIVAREKTATGDQ